ncbi:hypothetical protein A3A71_01245 [Candidatus Berkelbacteria bacterium RIFCSPLOWO2_01_FULL_50_28]|uniref:Bacterial type II secretion system protein E domain-containing protein n=1 Tax=Candidatus Berkelbacteria bacterium RIFCSPLOWO2_01_FULL_50_28 TaxID=1797471 RepID=A0A1F5EBB8_9BACT|nr:MAG: hypothetical protein A2807_01815 [Candidatus Berkelbacteria bacterium RIFCSPHIGHO2_01_FULL_50_36]OGD63467.1 MAG: hypothetical protein A3F39_03215 [Candidatus Berkelbacteria bacterium RIFCSPHIGHO2_12_FULL_50_11]OGD64663.1 MAG: hypothetical protein A3A71_01245 [Candidatus Berkelbacteria bacterium RIFCSPLOWO2_01_FULL_50_28]
MAVTNDILKAIGEHTGFPGFKSRAYLKGLTDIIGSSLAEGDHVKIDHFGEFKLLRLPERKLQTNFGGKHQTVTLGASTIPDFVIDTKLQEKSRPSTDKGPDTVEVEFRTSRLTSGKSDIDFIDLKDKVIPKNILALIPEKIARKYLAVPFALKDKTLYVAMTDPENEEAFNAIRKSGGNKIIKAYLTTQDDLNHIFEQYSTLQAELKQLVDSSADEELETVDDEDEKADSEEITEASPAAKIVATLLKRAVREKASDIHIEPSEEEVMVRFRVDGVLRKVLSLPKQIQPALISRVKILANLKIDETRLPQDGRIQILLDSNKVDFRISTLPTVNGEKVVARVLDHSKGVMKLEEINVVGRSLKVLEDNIKKAHGMILVTGPTGSGKSTTLYAIITKIKDVAINIITMEDPVEYRMPGVNQSQVNSKIDFTFASGLRSILRQDPDVVMVGEIRDRETADIAINAALTGHIVLSTLHTNDASGAIPRLLDMGVEPFLITSSVNAIVAQRLCRKICDKCRQETKFDAEVLSTIEKEVETMPDPERSDTKGKLKFYKGTGCEACGNSGYKGRLAIYEILGMSELVKQLTIKRSSSSDILAQAQKEGLITMKQDGILKAIAGLTTMEEIWRVTRD